MTYKIWFKKPATEEEIEEKKAKRKARKEKQAAENRTWIIGNVRDTLKRRENLSTSEASCLINTYLNSDKSTRWDMGREHFPLSDLEKIIDK